MLRYGIRRGLCFRGTTHHRGLAVWPSAPRLTVNGLRLTTLSATLPRQCSTKVVWRRPLSTKPDHLASNEATSSSTPTAAASLGSAVQSDLGLSRFLMRVYATAGVGMGAGLGTATLLSQLGPSLWMLGGGFVVAMGSILALYRLLPVYTERESLYKGIVLRERVLDGPPGRYLAYGALCAGMGAVIAPMVAMTAAVSPTILPVATCLSVATMGGASLFAYLRPEGSLLSWGAPLSGALTGFVGLGLLSLGSQLLFGANVFSDVWMHVDTIGGIGLFSALTAYETHLSVQAYRSGQPDHVECATSLYLNFINLLIRIMKLLVDAKRSK